MLFRWQTVCAFRFLQSSPKISWIKWIRSILNEIHFKKTKFKVKFKFMEFSKFVLKFKFIKNSWADSNSKFKFNPTLVGYLLRCHISFAGIFSRLTRKHKRIIFQFNKNFRAKKKIIALLFFDGKCLKPDIMIKLVQKASKS